MMMENIIVKNGKITLDGYVSIGADKNNEETYEFYNIDWRV